MKSLPQLRRPAVSDCPFPVAADRRMTKAFGTVALLCVLASSAAAQSRRPMTFEDFAAVKYVSDPQLSPDGTQILYAVRTTDLARNTRRTVTYLQPLAGGARRQFPDDATAAVEARWSPDGRRVAYVSGGQLWVAQVDGSMPPRQVTSLHGGVGGIVWAPPGDRIAFASSVYPDCADDACNVQRARASEAAPTRAVIADNLLFRHWTTWRDSTRSHLFVVSSTGGAPVDVTRGAWYNVPVPPFSGSENYSFSPDGREIAYTARDATREEAWSTDLNIYTVPVTGGAARIITQGNRGADQNPVYSPDRRFIVFASQQRAGFESDRWRLMSYDRSTGEIRELAAGWDRNADAYVFSPTGDAIYIQTLDAGRDKIFRLPFNPARPPALPTLLISGMNNAALSLARDGRTAAWIRDAVDRPADIYVAAVTPRGVSGVRQLTRENEQLLAQLHLNPFEDFWFRGADGDTVHGFVLKPPQWRADGKYPAMFIIHGGPQSAFLDNWHGRWNFQLFASQGWGVVAINPRGSPGYGQRFIEQVTQDWAGRVYTDLMNGLEAALQRNSWLDRTRMGAAGASYGGYTVNWIAGHDPDKFKALFTHAGVYNLESMFGSTEELWFVEWEFGGFPWDPRVLESQFRRWSPHLSAGNFKAPHLVVHGQLDFRVPYAEGLQLFTALQRRGVPSRLVLFPDEGHWIGKPQNQKLWWSEVLGWFRRWL